MMNTKLLTVFDVYEDESEALDSFKIHPRDFKKHPCGPFEDTLQ